MSKEIPSTQVEKIRDNFNSNLSKKPILGKTKKVTWESKRRFSNI
jgi:hypothetical protein